MKHPKIIENVLRDARDWVPSYQFVNKTTPYGWIGQSGDRAARKMVADGIIERRKIGKYAHYRWPQPNQQKMF
jgi:hypothetical protein